MAKSKSHDWRLWQLADSAFPTGGFAHSGGLEAAWQMGFTKSSGALRQFLVQHLRQAVHGAIPFVKAAHDGAQPLVALDEMLDAMLSNHVANRASKLQGRALLATAEWVFSDAVPAEWRSECLASGGHLAVVFGAVMRHIGVDSEDAVRLYLFITMRSVLSAAVRLGVVGPLEAQHMQAGMDEELEALTKAAEDATLAEAANTSPLMDLLQSTQDRLYSRLFQS